MFDTGKRYHGERSEEQRVIREILDGGISREEYYRLKRQEKGAHGELAKWKDAAQITGREI